MEPAASEEPQVQEVELAADEEKKRKREDSTDESEIPNPKKVKLDENSEAQNASTTAADLPKSPTNTSQEKKPQQKPFIADGKKKTFKFGNYIGYYGYRLNERGQDPRIGVLKPEWFDGKEVLDIGCNSGVFTLQLACYFNVKKVEGRDIDSHLIDMAIKTRDRWYEEHFKLPEGQAKKDIAKLVTFKTENFVAESLEKKPPAKAAAPSVTPAYAPAFASGLPVIKKHIGFDVVTCMSVTKWIHLNWGDEGILAAFKRFQQLVRIGGYLIIEIQDWSSYKKKKDMTETTAENFTKIKLRPNQFADILAERFYFKFIEELYPVNPVSKGFTRPISVFQRI